jgi:hypothetical protein
MDELSAIAARVNGSNAVAELLDAAFDAFEFIRQVARACEVLAPELFAAFMLAAGSAVEGRNTLNDAPSLPHAHNGLPLTPAVSPGADVGLIADELAVLAALVAHRLSEAVGQADLADDRNACEHATRAAVDIQRLLGQGTNETSTR